MMRVLFKFCYKKYINPHIVNIIQNNPKYEQCVRTLEETIKYNPQPSSIAPKLNMIFNVYSVPQSLAHHTNTLCSLILNDNIKNQSDLDRVIGWLHKNIKNNSQINHIELQQLLSKQDQRQEALDEEIQKIVKEKNCTISQVCKVLREKFICVDSKHIYKRVTNIFNCIKEQDKSIGSKKENKQFWDKLPNLKSRLIKEQCNSSQVYNQHIKITNNVLRFRFPPQPNGYLHIGHIKAMRINFETAKRYNGVCYLRYDDTNPQTQSHQYIDNIIKNVRWLGYQPHKITYASDYFQQMQQFAIRLIKQGNAYVCDSKQEYIQQQRKNKQYSPYRNRSISQSLSYFPNLKQGQTLRLKLNPQAKNPTLRDPIIYRVKEMAHPRTKNNYRIYPMYDFAHCICDSIQHIDYSLCSLEFQVRRELYYSILDLLGLYKPYVWQYSRLNVQGSVISKRKIRSLIQYNVIQSWDDPRLLTIGGLINRGYSPQMLIRFIDKVNSSRTGNENIVQYSLLQRQMRKILQESSKKTMAVLQPKLVSIVNTNNVEIKQVYIQEQENIQQGTYVVLKYAGVHYVDKNDQKLQLRKVEDESPISLKEQGIGFKILHWICRQDAVTQQITVFSKLLDDGGSPLPLSKVTYQNAKVPTNVHKQKSKCEYWQFQRLGYFKYTNANTNNADGLQLIRCTTLK